jgi:hypothetical protein
MRTSICPRYRPQKATSTWTLAGLGLASMERLLHAVVAAAPQRLNRQYIGADPEMRKLIQAGGGGMQLGSPGRRANMVDQL